MAEPCRACGASEEGTDALQEYVEHTFDELTRLTQPPAVLETLIAFDRGAHLLPRADFMTVTGDEDPASWRAFRRSPLHFVISRPAAQAAQLADRCIRAAASGQ